MMKLDLLKELNEEELEEYRKLIEFCEQRKTGTEGIPAIIGLDDLTDTSRTVYETAPCDEELKMKMAEDALIFTYLYSQLETRDMDYPCIAPAMSAMAEKDYYTQEGEEPVPYREMLEKGKE